MEAMRITADELKAKIESGEQLLIVDTRNPTAWDESPYKIRGAVRIPLVELERHFGEFTSDQTIVFYCT